MAMYRALFPVEINDSNKFTCYDIAIVPEHVGAISPHWWHAPINELNSPEAALKRARKILKALLEKKKCPCAQERCLAPYIPDYEVPGASKGMV